MTRFIRSWGLSLLVVATACDDDVAVGGIPEVREDAGGGGAGALDPSAGMDIRRSDLDAGDREVRDAQAPAAPADAATDAASPLFPADWCARAGADEAAQSNTFFEVVLAYSSAQSTDCATAGLLIGLSSDQGAEWLAYLLTYGHAMAGCPPELGAPEGGIGAFGPANTPAVGADRPALGADDAERLTSYYVTAFGDALDLTDQERAAVTAHLLLAAQAEIDAEASGVLSTCGGSTDAGL